MPTIKLSDTETLQVIHHLNNLDMAKHLAGKLQQAINAPIPGMTEAQQADGKTRQAIANALNMPWGANCGTDDIVAFIRKNCTKGDAQTIKELRRDLEREAEASKYLRGCLQEIGTALNQTNLTPASVVETALVYIKTKETTEHPDTYKVRSIQYALTRMSGHRYQEVLQRINDIVEQDAQTGPIKTTAQLAAEAASDPVLQLTAKNSELEAKLAQANRVVQDVRNAVNQPHKHHANIVSDIIEILK